MAPVAALAALYALFVDRRLAIGLATLLVNSISLAGIAVLFMGLKSHDSSNNLEAIAAILLPVPLTAMLLWDGMIRHWTSSKKGTAAFMAFVVGGTLFVGEIEPIRGRKTTPRVQLGAVPPAPTPSPRLPALPHG